MAQDTGAFIVGPGIAAAMEADNTGAASDEIVTKGGRPDPQWAEAIGENGTLYRWVKATNTVYRYPAN